MDRRTDGGDYNIPFTFLKKRGVNKVTSIFYQDMTDRRPVQDILLFIARASRICSNFSNLKDCVIHALPCHKLTTIQNALSSCLN